MRYLLLFLIFCPVALCIRCAQCNGWHGSNPMEGGQLNSCDNRNNQCQTDQFCIKIVDPMAPKVKYTTYKSDCWFQPTVQVTPSNMSNVYNNICYDFQDASVPPKSYKYCFCNDRDYCNSSRMVSISLLTLLLSVLSL